MTHSMLFLAEQATSGVVFAWPVTLILGLWVVVAATFTLGKGSVVSNKVELFLIPLFFPIALIIWGAVFRWTSEDPYPPAKWKAVGVAVILLLQVPVAIWVTRRAYGARMLAASWFLFTAHFAVWAAFVAGMSVTGDWL